MKPRPPQSFPTMTWILSCIASRGPLSSISLLALDQSRATEHDRPKNTGVFLSGILRVQFRSFAYLLAAGTANCRIERWPRHTTMSLGSLFLFSKRCAFWPRAWSRIRDETRLPIFYRVSRMYRQFTSQTKDAQSKAHAYCLCDIKSTFVIICGAPEATWQMSKYDGQNLFCEWLDDLSTDESARLRTCPSEAQNLVQRMSNLGIDAGSMFAPVHNCYWARREWIPEACVIVFRYAVGLAYRVLFSGFYITIWNWYRRMDHQVGNQMALEL